MALVQPHPHVHLQWPQSLAHSVHVLSNKFVLEKYSVTVDNKPFLISFINVLIRVSEKAKNVSKNVENLIFYDFYK